MNTPFEDPNHKFRLERDVEGLWKAEAFSHKFPIGNGASYDLKTAKMLATKTWSLSLDALLVRLNTWIAGDVVREYVWDGKKLHLRNATHKGFSVQHSGKLEDVLQKCLIEAEKEEAKLAAPRDVDTELVEMPDDKLLTEGKPLFKQASGKVQLATVRRVERLQCHCDSFKTARAIEKFLDIKHKFEDVRCLSLDVIYLSKLWRAHHYEP